MASKCWAPNDPDSDACDAIPGVALPCSPMGAPTWTSSSCSSTDGYAGNESSTAIVCDAVANLAIACFPRDETYWTMAADSGYANICGESPTGSITGPLELRAFNNGFSKGFG